MLTQEKWTFDEDVTEVFEDMLSRSIPQYEVMRQSVTDLALKYHQTNTPIIDLGTSRGESLAPLVNKIGAAATFIGLEVSEPMLETARKRFEGFSRVEILKWDLREGLPIYRPSVYLSILTLQFTPINYRQSLIQEMYDKLYSGGALILVEKVLGNDAQLNNVFVDTYHKMKFQHGYSWDEIRRKSLALEGVLVPVTAKWNEELLRQAGFKTDCFWRWMNFAGWVAYK